MKNLAQTLRAQAQDLKTIGEGEGLKGKYADKLRDGACKLEGHLRQTAERYEHVHGYLSDWADELEGMQSEADGILRSAQAEDESAKAKQQHSHQANAPHDDPMSQYHTALSKVTSHRDDRANYYAHKINSAISDGIKDSTWDEIKDTIDDWKSTISLVVDIMSWVATAIAVVALFCTPAGWIAGLAIWLTVGVLAGHLMLAAAGDGSWMDVAMDVFALATLGMGKIAAKGLAGLRTATKTAAQAAADEKAAAAAARANRSLMNRTATVLNRRGATAAEKAAARQERNIARAQIRRAGQTARQGEADTPMAEASRREALTVGGDEEIANPYKDIVRMRNAYPDSSAVQQAGQHAETYWRLGQAGWGLGTAADTGDKVFGSSDLFPMKPSSSTYGDFKDRYTKEVCSTW